MRIGIIGSGNIGGTAARLFAHAGHPVALSNSRGPDSLTDLVASINAELPSPLVEATTSEDAARSCDVVLLALPWRAVDGYPAPELVAGKIVIDAMNPYTPEGGLEELGDSTSSGEVAARLPGARIVKAFNTIYWEHLASQGRHDRLHADRRAIPLASDDAAAKARVARLIEEIGFAAVDSGTLRDGGRRQQPGTPIYNRDITGAAAEALLREEH